MFRRGTKADPPAFSIALVGGLEAFRRGDGAIGGVRADLVADGVLTVAGFRIANESLQRLSGRGALASETAQREAQTLVTTLRSTMGDAILETGKPKPRATRQTTRSTAAGRRATPPAAAQPAPARPARDNGADPFQNIGN